MSRYPKPYREINFLIFFSLAAKDLWKNRFISRALFFSLSLSLSLSLKRIPKGKCSSFCTLDATTTTALFFVVSSLAFASFLLPRGRGCWQSKRENDVFLNEWNSSPPDWRENSIVFFLSRGKKMRIRFGRAKMQRGSNRFRFVSRAKRRRRRKPSRSLAAERRASLSLSLSLSLSWIGLERFLKFCL